MREIPPEIWMMAVAQGKLHRAYDETKNMVIHMAMFSIRHKLEAFVKSTRKDVKK